MNSQQAIAFLVDLWQLRLGLSRDNRCNVVWWFQSLLIIPFCHEFVVQIATHPYIFPVLVKRSLLHHRQIRWWRHTPHIHTIIAYIRHINSCATYVWWVGIVCAHHVALWLFHQVYVINWGESLLPIQNGRRRNGKRGYWHALFVIAIAIYITAIVIVCIISIAIICTVIFIFVL